MKEKQIILKKTKKTNKIIKHLKLSRDPYECKDCGQTYTFYDARNYDFICPKCGGEITKI